MIEIYSEDIKKEPALRLNEMSIKRADAINSCKPLGRQFIKHFHKIYNNPNDDSIDHWIMEMQGWFDDIKSITLKPNSRHLFNTQISDWFFTACSEPENYMDGLNTTDDELISYDDFCTLLLVRKDVRESLKELDII